MGRHSGWYVSALDLTLAGTEGSPRQRSVTRGAVSQRELHTGGKAEGAGAVITQVKERQAEVTAPAQAWAARWYKCWGTLTLGDCRDPPPLPPQPPARAAGKGPGSSVCSLSQGHRGGSESPIWVPGVSPGLVGTW